MLPCSLVYLSPCLLCCFQMLQESPDTHRGARSARRCNRCGRSAESDTGCTDQARWSCTSRSNVSRVLCGSHVSILLAVHKRDGDLHPIDVRQIDLFARVIDDVSRAPHHTQMLEVRHRRHAEQFVQVIVRGRVELIVLVQRRIQERDAMAHRTLAVFLIRVRIHVQRGVVELLDPVVVRVGVHRQRLAHRVCRRTHRGGCPL